MCGIVGFFTPGGFDKNVAKKTVQNMRDSITYRGPNDKGYWIDENCCIAMGHRRLSILDLSDSGSQPMKSASGRYILAFNGEIYNHKNIRKKLSKEARSGFSWRGSSDTETLLEAIEAWGLQHALSESVGMFAIALWDRKQNMLHLARDRMGEKPLFYGWQGGTLFFASELKALYLHKAFKKDISSDALQLFLRFGYVPAPLSIWKNIFKLSQGCILGFKKADLNHYPLPEPYWELKNVVKSKTKEKFNLTDRGAIDGLEKKLIEGISLQMQADVPVGGFLSGGIDSSLVAALMQQTSKKPINTFTIGFDDCKYNEAEHAKEVAKHLQTNHTEYYVSGLELGDVVAGLPDVYDEPLADPSAIPTILVSRLAREKVTVSLSGDGGDELFAGYGRYYDKKAIKIWNLTQHLPRYFKKFLKHILHEPFFDFADDLLFRYKSKLDMPHNKSVIRKLALIKNTLDCESFEDFYLSKMSSWKRSPMLNKSEVSPAYILNHTKDISVNNIYLMMFIDSLTYLPDDILQKVDRAAMSTSLETRMPFMNHNIMEYIWGLPFHMKFRDGESKWILKQLLYRYVPRKLVERPKMGFGIPIDNWLRFELKDWGSSILSREKLLGTGLIDPKPVLSCWENHQKGRISAGWSLWNILTFQNWFERHVSR